MAAGPIATLLPMLGKLMGGAGGAQAAAPGAPPPPGPFDAIMSGQPNPGGMPTPPMPAPNPSMFGPAQVQPATPPLPTPKGNSLFDDMLPKVQPPMPEPGTRAINAMAGGQDGEELGGLMMAEEALANEKAAANNAAAGKGVRAAPAKPINSQDARSNDQRFRDAGYGPADSGPGVVVPKTDQKANTLSLFSAKPTSATLPAKIDEVMSEDAAPGVTPPGVPKLDKGLFDQPQKVQASPTATAAGDDDDEANGMESGMSLFGPTVGGYMGDFQDKLGDSATNPLFQVGMGLLAGGHDGTNPWTTMNRGLQALPGHQLAAQGGDLAQAANSRAEKDQARQDQELLLKKQQEAAMAELLKKYAAMGQQEPGSNVARGSAKVIR